MRIRLAAAALVMLLGYPKAGVAREDASYTTEIVIDGIRLSLSGPQTLPLSVVLRESPAYDGPRNFFKVSLKNESEQPRSLPFDELRRNIVLVYRNPATDVEVVDNRTPPPKLDGSVEGMVSGETKTFEIVFEYPARIATMEKRVAVLHFCVKWETNWLRGAAYAPGAYDWNPSFELCNEIRIVDDNPSLSRIHGELVSSNTTARADAARYLGEHGDRSSIGHLIRALRDESSHDGRMYREPGMATTRYWANRSLKLLTGMDLDFVWNDARESRLTAINAWHEWQNGGLYRETSCSPETPSGKWRGIVIASPKRTVVDSDGGPVLSLCGYYRLSVLAAMDGEPITVHVRAIDATMTVSGVVTKEAEEELPLPPPDDAPKATREDLKDVFGSSYFNFDAFRYLSDKLKPGAYYLTVSYAGSRSNELRIKIRPKPNEGPP